MVAGRKSVVANRSSSLVKQIHELDYIFSAKEVNMKVKPGKKKDDVSDEDDNDELDEEGYKTIPTVGVSKSYFCFGFSLKK